MKLDRFRAPALAATAVLLISGAASAFAAGPVTLAPARRPVAPVGPVSEPTGPETDTLQVGDQTTPDVAGTATIKASETATAETAAEAPAGTEAAGTEAATTEAAGTEAVDAASDGTGGHADPAGQNVDHQFDGQE